MFEFLQQAWDFHFWSVTTVVGAMVALVSILADRKRQRRTTLESVGFMPWTGLSVAAMLVTIIALSLAIKQG